MEHAADVARVDSPILAHISEDRRGETIADATAARPEGPAVDGELDRPRLATNPRHDGCCVQQPLMCVPNPLSIYLRRRLRSHRAIERFSLIVTTASDYEHASPPRAFPTAGLAKARRGWSTRKILVLKGLVGGEIVADPGLWPACDWSGF